MKLFRSLINYSLLAIIIITAWNCNRSQDTSNRASGSDEKMQISPAVKFSLEEAMEYIRGDEYVEVTPKAIRLRKILLSELDRKRQRNNA